MRYTAGVDEVGRGPLAGPVITAAVILKHAIPGVKDSKKLTPKKREHLARLIREEALCYAYGRAEALEVDRYNIHHATLLAMKRAIEALPIVPQEVMVDGLYVPNVNMLCTPVVQGDLHIEVIGAASILAKVLRDEEMVQMDAIYPGYGFAKHKGYPTKEHRDALRLLGPSPIHRTTFSGAKQPFE